MRRKTEWKQIARRRIGRQTMRQENGVRAILGETKVQIWSKMAMDREGCKRIVDKLKTHREEETGSTLKHKNPLKILLKFQLSFYVCVLV
jgi:hypothetical protein